MYRTCINGVWSAEIAGPQLSSARIKWFSLVPLKNSDDILVLASDTGTYKVSLDTVTANFFVVKWNGSSFGTVYTLEDNIGAVPTEATTTRECFAGSYRLDPYMPPRDTTPPAAVTDLTGIVLGDGKVQLSWSTPGDDGWLGVLPCGSRYKIVYSTAEPTDSELTWPATYCVLIATYGVSSPQTQTYIIQNLPYETTWYFRLRTRDDAGNWSELSNACTLFVLVPPGKITDLQASPGFLGETIELTWTAPGDDGYIGMLIEGSKYAIQRSTWEGVEWSTSSVDTIIISTQSVNPGDLQKFVLTGLTQRCNLLHPYLNFRRTRELV